MYLFIFLREREREGKKRSISLSLSLSLLSFVIVVRAEFSDGSYLDSIISRILRIENIMPIVGGISFFKFEVSSFFFFFSNLYNAFARNVFLSTLVLTLNLFTSLSSFLRHTCTYGRCRTRHAQYVFSLVLYTSITSFFRSFFSFNSLFRIFR